MEITKQHVTRYYGKFTGDESNPEEYENPQNYRPHPITVEFLVIHCTEGFEAGDKKVLSGQTDRRVSTHYYITKRGEVIEYVDPSTRAWHAGESQYTLDSRAWSNFNNFSIGVELENRYVEDPKNGSSEYTEIQLQRLYELHLILQGKFPALRNLRRTVGHEDISGFRGKTDPGPKFDWHRFQTEAFPGVKIPPPPYSVTLNGDLLAQKLILVEGSAYLPLRAIAQACGLEVKWLNQDKRVELVTRPQTSGEK